MKKFAALVGAGAMLLSMAVPAFATFDPFDWLSDDVSIHNYGYVKNDVDTSANSGWNSAGGLFHGGLIFTGQALSGANVGTELNNTVIGCACAGVDDISIGNFGKVKNYVDTDANTGWNHTFGGGFIKTGGATGSSVVQSVVNFTSIGGVAQ